MASSEEANGEANAPALAGDAIQHRLVQLIQKTIETPLAPNEITADSGLLGRGIGLDSIEILALVSAIETEFGVTIEDSELKEADFATVGTLVAFVRRRLPG